MVKVKPYAKFIALAFVLAVQGCAFAPKPTDVDAQLAALERWNRCLQRFEQQHEHYCDGHRRDLLATFPVNYEKQVNALLAQQTRVKQASTLMKTGLGDIFDASENPAANLLNESGTKARSSDL